MADIVDARGAVVSSFSYDPFGNIIQRSGKSNNLFKFSGQFGVLSLRESGLYLTRTRLYNAKIGRFVSPDVFGFEGSPRNLYLYAKNNPYSFVDPEGTLAFLLPFLPAIGRAAIGAVVGVGIYAVSQIVSCQSLTWEGAAWAAVTGGLPLGGVVRLAPGLNGLLRNAVSRVPFKRALSSNFLKSARNFFGPVGSRARRLVSSERGQKFTEEFVGNAIGDGLTATFSDAEFNPYSTIGHGVIGGGASIATSKSYLSTAAKVTAKIGEAHLNSGNYCMLCCNIWACYNIIFISNYRGGQDFWNVFCFQMLTPKNHSVP